MKYAKDMTNATEAQIAELIAEWGDRRGQIAWRLQLAQDEIAQMRKDDLRASREMEKLLKLLAEKKQKGEK